jgi:hypothetical protein
VGDNNSIINLGRIGGGVFMTGFNPTLTLQRGSVIEGAIAFGPAGISTLNVERGMSLRYFLVDGQPDVLNTASPSFQVGNQLLVVDPTGFAASDVMIGDLTSAIFDAVNTRGGTGRGNAGGRLSTQGAGGHTKVWASLIGGFGTVAGSGALTDIDTQFYGLIAGVDMGQVGAFVGTSTSSADSEFNTQDVDMDSIFAGVNWRPQLAGLRLIWRWRRARPTTIRQPALPIIWPPAALSRQAQNLMAGSLPRRQRCQRRSTLPTIRWWAVFG